MGAYNYYPLGKIASVQTGPFGSQLHMKDYVEKGTPIITVEHLGDNKILHDNLPCVSDQDCIRLSKYDLREGDIVFSRVGSVDRCAYVKKEEEGWLFSGRCLRIRVENENVDPRYLSFYFGQPLFKSYIRQVAVGATMPSLNTSIMSELSIPLPPLAIQKKIAAILSSLDDKIELNTRMNNVLEEIARALFRRWFVEFEFPDNEGKPYKSAGGKMVESEVGMVPEGWDITSLDEHTEVMRGFSYKGSGLSADSGIPMHNLNSVLEGGGYKYAGIKHYTGDVKDKFRINNGEIVVANTEQGHKYLLIGYPAIIPKYAEGLGIFSHHLYRIRLLPNSPCKKYYLYYLLLSSNMREQIIGCTNGTTVNMLQIDGLKKPKFILPSSDIIQKYDAIVSIYFQLMEHHHQESKKLADIRDSLLPKLMNGEVEV